MKRRTGELFNLRNDPATTKLCDRDLLSSCFQMQGTPAGNGEKDGDLLFNFRRSHMKHTNNQ